MNHFNPFYLISAARPSDTPDAARAKCETLAHRLARLGFHVDHVRGCYAGHVEPAVIAIPMPGRDPVRCEALIAGEGILFEQESVLHVTSDRHASLWYLAPAFNDGEPIRERVALGRFESVPETVARDATAWTERCGQYYVCAGTPE